MGRGCPPPLSYSYFSVATGSSLAARFAGSVPKITPIKIDVTSAITALAR